ncbi:MAG: TolC family outer membrane protein, partial [bacterium]
IDSLRVLGENATFSSRGDIENDTEQVVVSLTQPIFDLSAWFTFRQGQALSEQAKVQFSADKQGQILKVAATYFDVLRASENLDTALAEEKALERQLLQTRERFEVGLLPITDVHESQAAFDNAVVNTLEARGALNIAFESLEVLTGQRHDNLARLANAFPTPTPEPADPEQWVEFAVTNNLTLSVSEHSMDAAKANARARKSDHLPSVSGSVTYTNTNEDGTSLENLSAQDTEGNVAAVTVQMPLFTGGLISANRRQAEQLAIQAKELYRATKRSVVQQARANHLQVVTDAARVKARAQAIISAESALEATEAGYEVGTRNIVDVLDAQRVLFAARRNFANTRYDYISSYLQLKQVSGQLSPEDIQQLNQWLSDKDPVTRATGMQSN